MATALKSEANSEKVRFQLDLRRKQANQFDQLVDDCGLSSRKELFNTAMTLFSWAVKETRRGRRVASYDPANQDFELVVLPALDYLMDDTVPAEAKPAVNAAAPQKSEKPEQPAGELVAS